MILAKWLENIIRFSWDFRPLTAEEQEKLGKKTSQKKINEEIIKQIVAFIANFPQTAKMNINFNLPLLESQIKVFTQSHVRELFLHQDILATFNTSITNFIQSAIDAHFHDFIAIIGF